MALTGTCPVCGREFERAETGRPRIYCRDNHRLVAFRCTHPLGWRLVGRQQPNPVAMLRKMGIDA